MSQHGRRRDGVEDEDEPVRRFGGFLTLETALVLGLVALIALGSLLVHVALPSKRETETVVGDKKVRITTVGKGGVLPGPVQPRTGPLPVATPEPGSLPPPTPKPRKTTRPVAGVATPTPTPAPAKGGGGSLPGGGNTGGGAGSGNGGGGGGCTVVLLCKPGQRPTPTPAPPAPTPAQPAPGQPAGSGAQPAGPGTP